jgi:hypothetical protein
LLLLLQPSFLQHYVQIASRKLLLFHGRRNLAVKGRQQQQQQADGACVTSSSSNSDLVIRLSDLVNSPVMAELQELLMLGPGAELERDLYSNWFSLQVCVGGWPLLSCLWWCWRPRAMLLRLMLKLCLMHESHAQVPVTRRGGSGADVSVVASCAPPSAVAHAEHAAGARHLHCLGP